MGHQTGITTRLGLLALAMMFAAGCTTISYPKDKVVNGTFLRGQLQLPATKSTFNVIGLGSGNHCEEGFRIVFFAPRTSGVSIMKAFDDAVKSLNGDWVIDSVAEKKYVSTRFLIFETFEECAEVRGLVVKFNK